MTTSKTEAWRPDWLKLFDSILTEPGLLGEHYRAFHNYSLGNQALATMQLVERGIPISPIASFNGWKEKGRKVIKGQKAIALWMPVTVKFRKDAKDGECEDGDHNPDAGGARSIFVMRNNWFAFEQTEPDERAECPGYSAPPAPTVGWDLAQALQELDIEEVPFESVKGNAQGYAIPSLRRIAVSPVAAIPHKTRFHELAHCLLHGNQGGELNCLIELDRCIEEAEAESTAFLCCAALGLPGMEYSRSYVQGWLSDESKRALFQKSASRVFSAANRILKAGLVESETQVVAPVQCPPVQQTPVLVEGQGSLF